MTEPAPDDPPHTEADRRGLGFAFLINAGIAVALVVAGILAESSGLIATAIDNAGDAAVYAISFAAVTRGAAWKTRAAQLSGWMLLILCAGVLADVVRNILGSAEPRGAVIMVMTAVTAAANILVLRIMAPMGKGDVNVRAAWTFSINDLASNLGVLVAGALVALVGRAWPDLVAGVAIALISAKGGVEILRDARRSCHEPDRSA